VARFLGLTNLVPGRVVTLNPLQVDTPLGRLLIPAADAVEVGQALTVLLRPEAARRAGDCPDEDQILIEGRVQACSFRGGHWRLVMALADGLELVFQLPGDGLDLPQPGQAIALALRPEALSLLVEKAHAEPSG
jgi:ABC-type Fe3+/spermidine/putrescine transport system ATPase subunit